MLNRLLKLSAIALSCGILATTVSGCSQTPEESKVYTIEDTINRIKTNIPEFVEEKLVPTIMTNDDGHIFLKSDKSRRTANSSDDKNFAISMDTIIFIKGMGQKVVRINDPFPIMRIKTMYYPPNEKYFGFTNLHGGLVSMDHFGIGAHFYPIIGTINRQNESTEYLINPTLLNVPLSDSRFDDGEIEDGRLASQHNSSDIKKPISSNKVVSISGEFDGYITWHPIFEKRCATEYNIKYPCNKEVCTTDRYKKTIIEYKISINNVEEVSYLIFNKKQGDNLHLTFYTLKKGGYKNEYHFVIPNKKNHIFTCGQNKFKLREKYDSKYDGVSITTLDSQFNNYKDIKLAITPPYLDFIGYILASLKD